MTTLKVKQRVEKEIDGDGEYDYLLVSREDCVLFGFTLFSAGMSFQFLQCSVLVNVES